jgi:hypothetical protein
MKSILLPFGRTLCFLLLAVAAHGQAVGTSGEISGTVSDPTGAVVVNASVTAVETAKGIQHSTVTDGSGHYRFRGLPPAVYSVNAESKGFAPELRNNVIVALGETSVIDLRLRVGGVSEPVEVSIEVAAEPIVDVERSSQANTLDQRYINGLPIDRRDYLTFTLLLPGVSQSLNIADSTDLRVNYVPQSGLSFYGNNGRGNYVTVDGGTFNGYSQYVMVNVSQDAVQEFQINRANYSAALGGASGASVNIVTKSGTNTPHGTLYGFFRDDSLDARDPFAFSQALVPGQPFSLTAKGQPVKNSLSRQQFGGTIGFPLKKDRTFMFLAYEGLRQDEQASIPLLTDSSMFGPQSGQQTILSGLAGLGGTPVPCLTGQPALPAAACAAILQNILTINPATSPLNQLLVNQFETNGGLLPFPITSHQGSARLDHVFNDTNQLSARYVAAHLQQSDPNGHGLSGFSNGYSELQWTSSLQASWLHTFNANLLNDLRVQWNINQYNLDPNELGGPQISFQGFGSFGHNDTLPSVSRERDYDFADNLTKVYKRHTFQLGVDELLRANKKANSTFMNGYFAFGDLPGGILSPCLQVPAACGVTATAAQLDSLQSFSLGLPQVFVGSGGDPTVKTMMPWTGAYFQDDWAVRSNFSLHLGMRYEVDQRSFVNTTYNAFSPRASFAWDPVGNHKTVVRGGYGIYYAPIILDVDVTTAEFATRQFTASIVPLTGLPGNPLVNSAALFQTFFAGGKILCGNPAGCISAADLAPFGIFYNSASPVPPYAWTWSTASNFQNPYSQQASLGVEHEFARDLSISANYIYVHTLHLPRVVDVNVLPGAPVMSNVPGTNGLPFQNWGAPQCQVLVNNPCFANPTLFNNNVFFSSAAAIYQGATLEVKKRYSHHFTVLANYTYSKALDDASDLTYWANNQIQQSAERSLSSFDQRHKIVLAGIIDSPFGQRVMRGFELAPVLQYNSSRPFSLFTGTDSNGDRQSFADRPAGAGRNTGIGPDYLNLNLRLSWRIKVREKSSVQFLAEAFNIANRTNYSNVNDTVGPAFAPPFNVHGSAALLPSQPLGYTADYPKREIQLGARLSF